MNSQMCPAILPMLLARVNTARQRVQDALLALAQALPTRNSSSITKALDKAKAEQKQAEAVMEELEAANNAVMSPAEARGPLGDEDDEELRKNGEMIWKKAESLEERREQAKQHQKWLRTGHKLILGLLTLCGILLSFDVVRTTLGVAEDSHLLLALGTLAVSCQVGVQALRTSRGHLGDTAREHRDWARWLYDRAERVATAKANGEAAAAIKRDIEDAQVPLGEVTLWLGLLVAAVNKDIKSQEQKFPKVEDEKFPEAEHELGIILRALGKASERHGGDMARRLEEVREELKKQREGTGMGHEAAAVTPRSTGVLLALGAPGAL